MKTIEQKSQKKQEPEPKRPDKPKRSSPVLRFSPTAWAKLLFFRDHKETEIGGFGVTAPNDLLFVQEFVTVKQQASVVSVSFDDEAVADFFDSQVDAGKKPERFARIWLHTHPGDNPHPSSIDEETFTRVFGTCDWAVMFILAQNGKSSARLRFNVGPGGEVLIPVDVDFKEPFDSSDREAWEAEYKANIHAEAQGMFGASAVEPIGLWPDCGEWLDQFEAMEPEERQFVLDELAARPELWSEMEVYDERG